MQKHFLLITLLAVFFTGLTAHAEDVGYEQMKGDSLKAVFFETTMIGEYRDYRDKTKTFNYREYHDKDGSTDYYEGERFEKGVWQIVGDDKICYRYPGSEYYNRTYCFFVFKTDKCFYKYPLGAMTLKGPRDWDLWTSRAIRKGNGGKCGLAVG